MPNVSDNFNAWSEKDFFFKTQIDQKCKNGNIQLFNHYIFNMNFLFEYCKRFFNIEFTKLERALLNYLFSAPAARLFMYQIYYKKYGIDLIDATIRFYISFYIFPKVLPKNYLPDLKEIKEDIRNYKLKGLGPTHKITNEWEKLCIKILRNNSPRNISKKHFDYNMRFMRARLFQQNNKVRKEIMEIDKKILSSYRLIF
tara:strand:- start:1224 stop:1820 length:597 start_codon:yes stop_codon:yes gene_type:complete